MWLGHDRTRLHWANHCLRCFLVKEKKPKLPIYMVFFLCGCSILGNRFIWLIIVLVRFPIKFNLAIKTVGKLHWKQKQPAKTTPTNIALFQRYTYINENRF
jgi:hypothetical protein